MDSDEAKDMDKYHVYSNRLASFTEPAPVAKRRASNASSRAPKSLSWPHKSIDPVDMARAGFVFQPLPSNPDNATCFLCQKALDGWEKDDNPIEEHLRHSPECGWAITAAVDANLGVYPTEDPRDVVMVAARKATFAGLWPHEGKKGWTCKTKHLVEAGWKYTPITEGDDTATCVYCQLALGGWEKTDKPWDEHYSRAPTCPFFSLISSKPAPTKAGQSKAAMKSKASRLSLQSVSTAVSDMTSLGNIDMSLGLDDSVLTTTSTMTTASKASKKAPKTKKAATSRSKKTRAKKDEAVEVPEPEPKVEVDPEPEQEEVAPPPPPKTARGRKRASVEAEDVPEAHEEAPAPKKRAVTKTRKARGSSATEVPQEADVEMADASAPVKKPAAKKATRKASGTRKASARSTRKASVATTASTASPPPSVPNDDEIDRQLEADLQRPLEDDEMMLISVPADVTIEPTKANVSFEEQQNVESNASAEELLSHTATTDFAMFDPAPVEPTEEQVEADLQSMKDEMVVDPPQPKQELEPLKVTKKSGNRAAKKPNAKTTKKGEVTAAPVEQPQPRIPAEADEPDELADAEVSFGSTHTVVRKSLSRSSLSRASLGSVASTASTKAPVKRGRPPKKKVEEAPAKQPEEEIAARIEAPEEAEPAAVPVAVEETEKQTSAGKRGRPPKKPKNMEPEEVPVVEASSEPKREPEQVVVESEEAPASVQQSDITAVSSSKIARKPVPAPKDSPFAFKRKTSTSVSENLAPPKTPGHYTSPAQSAKQPTVSPSPSPQTSDAENQPPSSKPSNTSSQRKRVALGELPIETPVRHASPTKQQNVISDLQSTEKWTAVDLDAVFEEFYGDQENNGSGAADRFFTQSGELSARERSMTVEEWIYHNAGKAERKLKVECEAMVTAFEKEGTRAMAILEGLIVHD